MAVTSTDVANAALLEIGANTITNISDNVPQAIRANALFPRIVRAELRKHAWSCALDRTSLTASVTAPSFGYTKQYPQPADFIRLWQVGERFIDYVFNDYTSKESAAFVIEGTNILCNESSPLKIRYVKDIQASPASWDALLFEVIVLRLALKLIPSTVKSDQKYQLIDKQYEKLVRTAKRVNAIELPPEPMADNSWMVARI